MDYKPDYPLIDNDETAGGGWLAREERVD